MKIKLLKKIIRLGDSSWGITLTAKKMSKYFDVGDSVWVTIESTNRNTELIKFAKENIEELRQQIQEIQNQKIIK